jgi:iron complex transport system ATP-binding protein
VNSAPLLEASDLGVRAGERTLVAGLGLALAPGEFIAVLGRNGSGKSLTLHTLAGLRRADGGSVAFAGRALDGHGRAAVARHLALLPQDREDALPLTAFESVMLGRHPHVGWLGRETEADAAAVRDALAQVGLAGFADRALATLSGGEQRRAALAALLAQEPRVYLLDEPTNHLDPHHQIDVLRLVRERCAAGAAAIATLHDPTLAVRCADRVLLLHGDGRWQLGEGAQLLNAAELSRLYDTPIVEVAGPGGRAFIPA